MMQRSYLRALFGAGLIGMAGVSLITGIFPMIMSWFFEMNSYQVMFMTRSFIIPISLCWVIAGGIVGWQGGAFTGALVVGFCGAISGFILGTLVVTGSVSLIMVSMLGGLVYGAIGGLIIGKAFPKPIGQQP